MGAAFLEFLGAAFFRFLGAAFFRFLGAALVRFLGAAFFRFLGAAFFAAQICSCSVFWLCDGMQVQARFYSNWSRRCVHASMNAC